MPATGLKKGLICAHCDMMPGMIYFHINFLLLNDAVKALSSLMSLGTRAAGLQDGQLSTHKFILQIHAVVMCAAYGFPMSY